MLKQPKCCLVKMMEVAHASTDGFSDLCTDLTNCWNAHCDAVFSHVPTPLLSILP